MTLDNNVVSLNDFRPTEPEIPACWELEPDTYPGSGMHLSISELASDWGVRREEVEIYWAPEMGDQGEYVYFLPQPGGGARALFLLQQGNLVEYFPLG